MFLEPVNATLTEAVGILFGPQVQVTPGFLAILQEDGLKAAFRSRALETHPDRAQVLGLDEELLHEGFRRVVWAYERLTQSLKERPLLPPPGRDCPRPRPAPRPARPAAAAATAPRFHVGGVPHRRLRIGEYLYYTGRVSWQDLMASLVWQKGRRPVFGRIALEWHLLSPLDLETLLGAREFGERIGECAIRLGLIKDFWVRTILLRQAKLQPLLGAFFVEQGLVAPGVMQLCLNRLSRHNQLFAVR
ncbi:MAG: J domain-containing protein [Deltaproteobacteria bacterium]|nr:J domain-containing protein [Deltaproteobacteria bacterium]